MNYRRLGNSGIRVSEVSLGTWLTFGNATDDATARSCIDVAFDLGINFYDCADAYAGGDAERVLGQALRTYNRDNLVVGTKCFFPMSNDVNDRGLSRKHIVQSVNASLKRLDMDYIDLLQCHRFDDYTPVEETVRAMDDLVTSGKILYWGVSQWSAVQISAMMRQVERMGAARPISNQPVYNMLTRGIEDEVMPTCAAEGMGLVVFSPLAQGILTGKYKNAEKLPADSRAADDRQNQFIKGSLNAENISKAQSVGKIAERLGLAPAALALAWCLRRGEISSVIVGASRPQQVEINASASGIKLEESVLREIAHVLHG